MRITKLSLLADGSYEFKIAGTREIHKEALSRLRHRIPVGELIVCHDGRICVRSSHRNSLVALFSNFDNLAGHLENQEKLFY